MVEGLVIILVCAFIGIIAAILTKISLFFIVLQVAIAAVSIYLLIRVRVKMSKAEKEKLRQKIEELEKKIDSFMKKSG